MASALRVMLVPPADYADGIPVVEAAKRATGFPLNYTASDVGDAFADRQADALAVWLAYHEDECVGHALVSAVPANVPKWLGVNDPVVRHARDRGYLAEFGSLAVHPDHHGQGIARALQVACLDWIVEHDLLGCASVWNDSVGSQRLSRQYGRVVGTHPVLPSTLFVYDKVCAPVLDRPIYTP